MDQLSAVMLLVVNNHLLAAHPSVPANNVQELIAWLKADAATATQPHSGSPVPDPSPDRSPGPAGLLVATLDGIALGELRYLGSAAER